MPRTNFNRSQWFVPAVFLVLVFGTRPLTALGAPKVLDFLHFAWLSVTVFLLLRTTLYRRAAHLLSLIVALLIGALLSALINQRSPLAAFFSFVILCEPFIFLAYLVGMNASRKNIEGLRKVVLCITAAHTSFILVQTFVLDYTDDRVQGLLIGAGAGAHLAGAISLFGAIFVFRYLNAPLATRTVAAGVVAMGPIFSDAKQVIAVALVATFILVIVNFKSAKALIKSAALAGISLAVVGLLVQIFFPSSLYWLEPDVVLFAFEQKFEVVNIIQEKHWGPLTTVFGLGPGATVSRLALLIPEYANSLAPFGILTSDLSRQIYDTQQSQFYTNSVSGSSLFSLTFSWAGIWGDLGLLGLVTAIAIFIYIYRFLCPNSDTRFLVICSALFGVVFTWLEEPAYMNWVSVFLGYVYLQTRFDRELMLKASGARHE